ncbi:MAG: 2-hydroxyacid dehydrogenase [Leptospiraceae bacterium]|nr:2-hydroxyacid dehydrogenase [Leptospiraceae bacterium]MDW7976220.1 2-hydroxyacid dehydrogenase [Leptospiraceae bacterium]
MIPKILFYSSQSYDVEFFKKWNKNFQFELEFVNLPLNERTASLSNGYHAVCIFVNDIVNESIAKTLSNNGVSLIALRCAGFNNVDIESTSKHNLKVVRVPAYSPNAVAEHAVSLILTLNRKTHKAYNRVKELNFSLNGLMGFDLNQKVVGVIGTGKIGSVFSRIMRGFGSRVLAYDIIQNPDLVKENIVEYVDLETLFRNSDIISLHCPLTPETKYIINEKTISLMKDGVMIINTGRGALIDTKAVIQGLKKRKIGYLGLDVYEQEENLFFKDHSHEIIEDDLIARLITFPNVLITSHQAFFTENALNEIAHTTLSNIYNFFIKKQIVNEVK